MRYRVNLYREREARGERVRKGVLRGAALGIVVAAEVLLIGALVISGFQFRERAQSLRRTVESLESRIEPYREDAGLPAARALLQNRVERVDWSVIMAALAENTPDNVVLTKVRGGRETGRGGLNGLEIEGRITGGARDLSPVIAYVDSLRSNPVLTARFSRIDLGEARGGTGQNFQVICRPSGEGGTP